MKRSMVRLYKRKPVKPHLTVFTANNVMQNTHFGYWNAFLFGALDKMSGFISKHPKIGKEIMAVTEKMIVKEKNMNIKI